MASFSRRNTPGSSGERGERREEREMTLRGSAGLWSGLDTAGPSCESAGELEEEGGRACCQLQSWAGHDNCTDLQSSDISKVNHC